MTKFQVILTTVFGFFIVVAVMVFAFYRGSSGQQASVVVWGDIPSEYFQAFLNETVATRDPSLSIQYVEKSGDKIDRDFTEALARGIGPDLLITTQDKFWQERTKLIPIPYKSVSERDFRDAFIEEGELFLGSQGIYALPLVVDPIVLYYNRDLLSGAGLAKPLAFWDEIYGNANKLTKRDAAGNITQSIMA
ncbi:extracellular solute-binding protein, partial [Candidatus Parcubacteria bacterium]|nr:extracellular solute-binding protein [Candidatus Parcubacteria bacterium]